jgi:5-oxoprolinase (ATP-hydrolysing) subunit A
VARIDLNCDLGEGGGHDAALMPLITSANIACGIHAGDVETMRTAVKLAQRQGVAVGAHPSLNDRANFGRKEMRVSPREVYLYVFTQTKLMQIIARQCDARVMHVKPHGALYNMAARSAELSDAVANAVFDVDSRLVLYGLAGSHLVESARIRGLRVASEVFADRTYQADGKLTSRLRADAIIGDENVAVAQTLRMLREGVVRSTDGVDVSIQADTICLHGDGPNPVEFATKLTSALKAEGFWIRAFGA